MRVAVVGGGISGLAAAYYLLKKGVEVELFEKDEGLGGIAASLPFEGTFLDKFYRHIFFCDKYLLSLIYEIGLSDDLHWIESRMGFYSNGDSYDFAGPIDLLKFKPLSVLDRIRFGVITLYLTVIRDWERLDKVTADKWLKSKMGIKGYETIWAPLLKAKFGESYTEVPLSWFWCKIQMRKSNRSKTLSNERLGYLDGSFQVLIDVLEEKIVSQGGVIHKSSPVTGLTVSQNVAVGIEVSGKKYSFDRILSTLPLPELIKILPDSKSDYKNKLSSIRHKAIIVLILKLKKQLSPYYWLNIGDDKIPFNLLLEHTNFIDPGKYNGKHVLYISNYTSKVDPLYSLGSEELLEKYIPHLMEVYPDFSVEDVEETLLFKNDFGTPVFTTSYREIIPENQSPIENLFLASGEQIYPEDRGMSKSIELVRKVIELM